MAIVAFNARARLVFEPVQERVGRVRGLVVKAPGEGDGGVDDEAVHRRPSLIKSLTSRPPRVWPLLNCFSLAMVSRICREFVGVTGTSRAIGVPWRVIVICSRAATRSRRR